MKDLTNKVIKNSKLVEGYFAVLDSDESLETKKAKLKEVEKEFRKRHKEIVQEFKEKGKELKEREKEIKEMKQWLKSK